ncbi:hypothetical protein LCGC14_2210440 [marine sediment metagenome]|uniref:Uncharacterized protein n=1 Tax=marine sediment metagenome TaxID=412755 RepID=A0A0F9DDW6_9ZZZZ
MIRITKEIIGAKVVKCCRYDTPPEVSTNSELSRGETRFYWIVCRRRNISPVPFKPCRCAVDGSFDRKTAERRAGYIDEAWRCRLEEQQS